MPRPALHLAAAAAALLSLPAVASPAPERSDGPLRLETGGTFGRLFLEPSAADARALPAPELDLRWTVANDWGAPLVLARGQERVLLQADEQSDALALSVRAPWSSALGPGPAAGRHGLWRRLSTGLTLRAVEHWGGWTDRPIEGWHRLLRFNRFGRYAYRRDAVAVVLVGGDGGGLQVRGPRLSPGDPVLRTRLLLADGGAAADDPARAGWGLSALLDVKVPLYRPGRLEGSGGWDGAAGLLVSAELRPWLTLHALAAATAVSRLALPVPLQPRAWRFTAEASLVARLGEVTLLLEDRVATAIFRGGWDRIRPGRDDGTDSSGYYGAFLPQNRVSGGLRWGHWTIWLSEDWTPGAAPRASARDNWFYDSNAPDLALGVTYTRPLPAGAR